MDILVEQLVGALIVAGLIVLKTYGLGLFSAVHKALKGGVRAGGVYTEREWELVFQYLGLPFAHNHSFIVDDRVRRRGTGKFVLLGMIIVGLVLIDLSHTLSYTVAIGQFSGNAFIVVFPALAGVLLFMGVSFVLGPVRKGWTLNLTSSVCSYDQEFVGWKALVKAIKRKARESH